MDDKIPMTVGINIDVFNLSHSNHNITLPSYYLLKCKIYD